MAPSAQRYGLPGTWDTHLHVLNPGKFPYNVNRVYTPATATLEQLMTATLAQNFLIVQASVEDGRTATLRHLEKASKAYPSSKYRAEIEIYPHEDISDDELHRMQDIGVRAIRVHGEIGRAAGDAVETTKNEFQRLAPVARKTGWYLSAMCSIATWNEISQWLVTSDATKDVKIIIEHSARLDPSRDPSQYDELNSLIELVAANREKLFFKICGINRMESQSDIPGEMKQIPPALLKIINALPDNVVWGSDWPHVNYHIRDGIAPNKQVDLANEIELLKQSLSSENARKLFVDNATRFYT